MPPHPLLLPQIGRYRQVFLTLARGCLGICFVSAGSAGLARISILRLRGCHVNVSDYLPAHRNPTESNFLCLRYRLGPQDFGFHRT